jgi:hydroxymethylbilane synthase
MLCLAHPGLRVRIEVINTKGDKILDTALSQIGDKGLFTRELEVALLDGHIDVAVHSLKDLPTNLPKGLMLGAVTRRGNPQDALVAPAGTTLANLRQGAVVATSSLRRAAQLLNIRPDITIVDVRGNVPTRIRKLKENGWDGMILAAAGLERLGLADEIAEVISCETMVPAVGQAALGIESRRNDPETLEILGHIEHRPTRLRIEAERALLRRLEGGCQVPIGAHATIDGDSLMLDAVIASLDGRRIVRDQIVGIPSDGPGLGDQLAAELLAMGGEEILAGVRG